MSPDVDPIRLSKNYIGFNYPTFNAPYLRTHIYIGFNYPSFDAPYLRTHIMNINVAGELKMADLLGFSKNIHMETAVNESRKETAARVARDKAD